MAFKIIKGHIILEPEMLPMTDSKYPSRKCKGIKYPDTQLIEPYSRLDNTQTTFFYATPKLWNSTVTEALAEAPSIDAFKNNLKKL